MLNINRNFSQFSLRKDQRSPSTSANRSHRGPPPHPRATQRRGLAWTTPALLCGNRWNRWWN